MKLKFVYISFFAVLSLIACDLTYQIAEPTQYGNYKQIVRKGITFRWNISNSNMNIVLIAPTEGWVGVGLKASSLMKDANVLAGYVTETNTLNLSDRFGVSTTNHRSDLELDGAYNFSEQYGVESNDQTEIAFSIPLQTDDSNDRQLTPGDEVYIKCFLAYGAGDGFSNTYHTISYFGIELDE